MRSSIVKWGNSLALRLPKYLAADVNLAEGTPVELRVDGGSLVVTPSRPKYRLEDLLARTGPEHRDDEIDFGGPVGNETW